MSLYFDLVINCDLKEDTPSDVIEAIKCLTSFEISETDLKQKPRLLLKGYNLWDLIDDYNLLAPQPEHNIITNFQPRKFGVDTDSNRQSTRYRLQYCASNLKDDTFHQNYIGFLHWLATVSNDNYFGFYKETDEIGGIFHHLIVENGALKDR